MRFVQAVWQNQLCRDLLSKDVGMECSNEVVYAHISVLVFRNVRRMSSLWEVHFVPVTNRILGYAVVS